jgi:hypothetical protein
MTYKSARTVCETNVSTASVLALEFAWAPRSRVFLLWTELQLKPAPAEDKLSCQISPFVWYTCLHLLNCGYLNGHESDSVTLTRESARFEVSRRCVRNITFFRDETPWCPVEVYWCFWRKLLPSSSGQKAEPNGNGIIEVFTVVVL